MRDNRESEITPSNSSSDEPTSASTSFFARQKGRARKKKDKKSSTTVKESGNDGPPPIAFKELFRFTSTIEKGYMLFGVVAAALHGGTMPVWTIIFGDVLKTFGSVDANPQDAVDSIGGIAKWFLVVRYICAFAWSTAS